jgi:thymidylate synthase (FAD)
VSDKPEFYRPKLREAALDKKQGSGDDMEDGVLDAVVEQAGIEAAKQYTYLLSRGVCEEQARMILPQSMLTEWIWSGSLDAFSRMVKLRLTSDAQQETREVAMQIYDIIQPLFPVSWDALMAQGK